MNKTSIVDIIKKPKVIIISTIALISGIALLAGIQAASGNLSVAVSGVTLSNPNCIKDDYIQFGASCAGGGNTGSDYLTNLNMIKKASPTATTFKGRKVGNTGFGNLGDVNRPLNQGNPHEYTPSAQLKIDDYVVERGDRYANYAQRGDGGVWHTTCQFSHFAYDDPIVFPGKPGASHLHMFFGNTHANAYSTSDTILNEGGSTCGRGELNRTSYWVPAVFDGSDAIVPDQLMVYYESYGLDQPNVIPFPEGLKFIMGDAGATSTQPTISGMSKRAVSYKCGWFSNAKSDGSGANNVRHTVLPEDCNKGTYSHIEMNLQWPFCWDGKNLDSNNHKSHMAYPSGSGPYYNQNACPTSHPITLPRITYRLHFNVNNFKGSTSNLRLSSDVQRPPSSAVAPNGVSSHGDWMSGWHKETLALLVTNCLKVDNQSCDPEHLGDSAARQFAKPKDDPQLRFTANQLLEYCPTRTTYTGNIQDVAYCTSD